MRQTILAVILAVGCGPSEADEARARDLKALDAAYERLDAYAACVAGAKEAPEDLFVALAFAEQVPAPSACPPPAIEGAEPPTSPAETHADGVQQVCGYVQRAHDRLGERAQTLGVPRGQPPRCAPTPPAISWVEKPDSSFAHDVEVKRDIAYYRERNGSQQTVAYSLDGSQWTTHEFEWTPLSYDARRGVFAALVQGGGSRKLHVGKAGELAARPQRKAPSRWVRVGESSLVLLGGDDTWLTAAWSTDDGQTFGPDQRISKPAFTIARRMVLGDADALVVLTAEESAPALAIDRAERGQPARPVERLTFEHPEWRPAVEVCQAASVIWAVAGARQVAVSSDSGTTWTALPPLPAVDPKWIKLACTTDTLGVLARDAAILCTPQRCGAPLAPPAANVSYLRVHPKPELWSLHEARAGGDYLVTVHKVEDRLVPARAYLLPMLPRLPLLHVDGSWVSFAKD